MQNPSALKSPLLNAIRRGSAAARALTKLRSLRSKGWDTSDFISHLKRTDKQLYDAAYNNFKEEALALGMGRVQAALFLAGITVQAGMNRHTTLEEDLALLLGRIDSGERVDDHSMRSFDSRLYNRLKKRAADELTSNRQIPARPSWKAVVYLLRLRRPDIDIRACFKHLPEGLYIDMPRLSAPLWYWSGSNTPQGRRNIYVDVLRQIKQAGLPTDTFAPDRFRKLSDGASQLVMRVNSDSHRVRQKWNWGQLVEEATGAPYNPSTRGRQSGAIYKVRAHERCLPRHLDGRCQSHRKLRSAEEAAVDGVLALLVGARLYEQRHAHDVPLSALGVEGIRGEVDIVLFSGQGPAAIVEVSNGTFDDAYTQRLRAKAKALQAVGMHVACVNGERAGAAYVRELREKLLPALKRAQLPCEKALERAVRDVSIVPSGQIRFPAYLKASRIAQGAQLQNMSDYQRRCKDLGLPTNPNIYYKSTGWTNWAAFLNRPLRVRQR